MAESRQERRRRERLESGAASNAAAKKPLLTGKATLVIIILIIAAIAAFGISGYMNSARSAPFNPVAAGPQIDVGEQSEGKADSPVTIIEYSDFECPFCGKFFITAYQNIKSDYIDKGKARLVFRQFPLVSIHKQSLGAAVAALCAADQEKFWEYHDTLFENQPKFGRSNLESYANKLGLDMEKFNSCLDSGSTVDQVNKEIAEGEAAGVDGTPFFLVGSQKISGAQPIETFRIAIEAGLSK